MDALVGYTLGHRAAGDFLAFPGFLLRQFFKSVPDNVLEAASMDGVPLWRWRRCFLRQVLEPDRAAVAFSAHTAALPPFALHSPDDERTTTGISGHLRAGHAAVAPALPAVQRRDVQGPAADESVR